MPDDPKPDGALAPASASPAAPAPTPPAAAPKPVAPRPAPPPKAPAVMVTTPWESELTQSLAAEFGSAITEFVSYLGQEFLVAQPEAAVPILQSLRDNHGFDYLVDVTAVHWPARDEQFDLIYVIYSFSRNQRIRIKVRLKDGARPRTAVPVFITADWLEREVFDMFGIEFEGHPNMKRILMPDEWETFPLRKENSILKMDQRWVRENIGIESGQ